MRLLVFLTCALVAPVLMAAAQPMRLQPSSQWVVDYAADSCRLVRNFGVGLGQESVVKVRLLVDATGKPTKCTSLSHFKESSFNDVVCAKFMDRAHFEPAELADGTKVPSFYTTVITFMMGD